jgi:hypothetical protein
MTKIERSEMNYRGAKEKNATMRGVGAIVGRGVSSHGIVDRNSGGAHVSNKDDRLSLDA